MHHVVRVRRAEHLVSMFFMPADSTTGRAALTGDDARPDERA